MKQVLVVFFTLLMFGCNTTPKELLPVDSFQLTSIDPEYGYTEKKPIELGGFLRGTKSAGAHIEYFEGLLGPNGEEDKRIGRKRPSFKRALIDSHTSPFYPVLSIGLAHIYE